MSKRLLFVLLTALLVLSPARASANGPKAAAHSLGIEPDAGVVAGLAAALPSAEHAWGTIMLAWCESGGPNRAAAVHIGEWGLREGRWMDRRAIRRPAYCPLQISLARSAGRLVLVTGSIWNTAEIIVLERGIRGSFEETNALTFEDAYGPSVDADENVLALGVYEKRTPVLQMPASSSTSAPLHVLHVRLLEASTLRILGARVFRGDHLLRPHQVPGQAGHALRILAGRLFVAVPDDEPRIVSLRLPSLGTERERTFVVPASLRTPFSSSIVLNRLGDHLLIGIDSTFVLSPQLDIVARHRLAITRPIAFDPASHRVLATDGEPVTLDGYRVRVLSDHVGGTSSTVLFAHGRGVVIEEGKPSSKIRVLL
jgi:hypothetical protein